MDERRELTDEQWTQLAAHLPPQRPATGRPSRDHRTVVEAILWRLRTGAPWRDLPERCGPWQSAYARFRRWQRAGVWDQALAAVQAEADAQGNLDWARISSTAPRCGPTNTQPGPKRGRRPSPRSLPRRLHHEDPPPRRRRRQADDPRPDWRT